MAARLIAGRLYLDLGPATPAAALTAAQSQLTTWGADTWQVARVTAAHVLGPRWVAPDGTVHAKQVVSNTGARSARQAAAQVQMIVVELPPDVAAALGNR